MSTTPDILLHWQEIVGKEMAVLSKPVATVLALWSFGIMSVKSCGRQSVAGFLALLLNTKAAAVEQRLYEWCVERKHKSGSKRVDWDVRRCFGPLLGWIVRLWRSEQMALVLDATSLGDRFTVLTISVVYRSMGLPVAWKILRSTEKHAWRAEWQALIRSIWRVIPRHWQVIVLADRGLYADWLFRRIARVGWHPFMRVNGNGCFVPTDGRPTRQEHPFESGPLRGQRVPNRRYLSHLLSQPGDHYAGTGIAFSGKRALPCTVLATWDAAHKDPWIVITDLQPQDCNVAWYALRGWCEQGFKCVKRGGWQWQLTRMDDPTRAERLWLALALAMLWCVAIGSALEDDPEIHALFEGWLPNPTDLTISKPARPTRPTRLIRLFRLGLIYIIAAAFLHRPWPVPTALIPSPWPIALPSALPP